MGGAWRILRAEKPSRGIISRWICVILRLPNLQNVPHVRDS